MNIETIPNIAEREGSKLILSDPNFTGMELLDSEEDVFGGNEDIEVSEVLDDETDLGLILDGDTLIHTDKDEDLYGNGSYDDTSVFQVLGPGRVQFIVDNPLDMETFWR